MLCHVEPTLPVLTERPDVGRVGVDHIAWAGERDGMLKVRSDDRRVLQRSPGRDESIGLGYVTALRAIPLVPRHVHAAVLVDPPQAVVSAAVEVQKLARALDAAQLSLAVVETLAHLVVPGPAVAAL